jgi:hypothetical protein
LIKKSVKAHCVQVDRNPAQHPLAYRQPAVLAVGASSTQYVSFFFFFLMIGDLSFEAIKSGLKLTFVGEE